MTLEQYIEKNEEYFSTHKAYEPEYVYEMYYEKVYPFLAVITSFKVSDNKVRMKELALALFVPIKLFSYMKHTFEELYDALNTDTDVMKLKAQIDVQKGLIATEYKNAKILEMQEVRYDDEYKPKGKEIDLNIPKQIDINFVDASIDESTLED